MSDETTSWGTMIQVITTQDSNGEIQLRPATQDEWLESYSDTCPGTGIIEIPEGVGYVRSGPLHVCYGTDGDLFLVDDGGRSHIGVYDADGGEWEADVEAHIVNHGYRPVGEWMSAPRAHALEIILVERIESSSW